MAPNPEVLVICVNYNGSDVLRDTLVSVRENRLDTQVVTVDNASSDESLQQLPSGVGLIKLPENVGYGAALNTAIQKAFENDLSTPEYFFLINNDLVMEPDSIGELVRFAKPNGPCVVGPKLLRRSDPTRLDAAWGFVTWTHVVSWFRGQGAIDRPFWNRPRRVRLLLGCALLVHRDVFRDVGLFDPAYFMYHEEVDFLYRCSQRGHPVYYHPQAVAYHCSGHSTREEPQKRVEWTRRNSVYFLRKHGAGVWPWLFWGMTVSSSVLVSLLRFRFSHLRAVRRGILEGFRISMQPDIQL